MKGAWASSRGRRGRGEKRSREKGRGGEGEQRVPEGGGQERTEGGGEKGQTKEAEEGTWILVQLNSYEGNSRQNVGSGRLLGETNELCLPVKWPQGFRH